MGLVGWAGKRLFGGFIKARMKRNLKRVIKLGHRPTREDAELLEEPDMLTKGMKSSEFWLTAGALVLVAFGPKIGVNLELNQILGLIGGAGSYAVSRGLAKKS